MKHKWKSSRGAGAEIEKRRLPIAILAVFVVLSISCNESSSEQVAEELGEDRVHADMPADPRREAIGAEASAPWEGASGIVPHEHEPKHGGVVRSVDVYHVELTDKPMRVWLYDRRGERFPAEGLEGQIVVYSDGERHPYTLQARDDHLVPVEPVHLPSAGSIFVELTVGKQSIDAAFELPLESETGDAG